MDDLKARLGNIGQVVLVSLSWIIGLAIIYLAVLYSDAFLVSRTKEIFAPVLAENSFARVWLEGFEALSTLFITAAYLIHVAAILIIQFRHLRVL